MATDDYQTTPQWDLSQLYTLGSQSLTQDLEELERQTKAFMSWRSNLDGSNLSLEDFKKITGDLESLTALSHRIAGFSHLAFAQNTQDQKALAFMAQVDEKMADLSNEILFFEIWWKELPDELAAPLLDSLPSCAYWLMRTRSFRPHTRPEEQEKVMNLKNITGHDALIALYDSIINRYSYSTSFLPGAEDRRVTRDELMVHARSDQAEVRAAAYQELYRVFGEDGPILGQIYQTTVRDWRIENLRLRNYTSPIEVRNKANDLSPTAVEALLNTVRNNASIFGDFFKLKAKALGLSKLKRYDLYAPLVADTEVLDFNTGLTEVLGALEAFSPRFRELAMNIIEGKRFSAKPQAGKQGGAFCYSMMPSEAPWILMTYNGRKQDLFTMAHELGHGIHSQLAAEHNIFQFHATLPLAETASTFAEMLLANRLLKGAPDQKTKANLLFHMLDDAYATIGRQAFFALFEIEAHEMVSKGATVDELAEAYYNNLTNQFQDAVDLNDEFRWEWVSIPHIFHTPFYVYAYSFGQLLVYSLWRIYEKEGPDFAPRLIELLAKGGSDSPENILTQSGLGPLDENFWQGGFEVIKDMLAELKIALA